MTAKHILTYDSTLRDGEQCEGITLSLEDKLRIVQRLDEFGIDYIEGGFPASNPKDVAFFQQVQQMGLRHAQIAAFGSTCRKGVAAEEDQGLTDLLACGAPVVTIVDKTWDAQVERALRTTLDENLRMIAESVAFLKAAGRRVVFDAEHYFDCFKTNRIYALQCVEAALRAGADSVDLCETNGGCLPFEVEEVVAATVDEAKTAAREMMEDKKFGPSGSTVVIEECMTGPEVTVLAFADGEHVYPMPASQDHKRAYDGNRGPNTGGMGAISPPPQYTPEIAQRCMDEIFLPTIAALKAEGRPFQGALYFGLMLTPDGPKVVEYNARFGDPECQAVLSLLDSDLMDIFTACREGTLDQLDLRWKDSAACCLVLASGGYPLDYRKGFPISGLEEAGKSAVVFHAGTAEKDGQIVTSGGRVLGVTALGDTLEQAIDNAYAAAKPISFTDMHFRTDIGRAF